MSLDDMSHIVVFVGVTIASIVARALSGNTDEIYIVVTVYGITSSGIALFAHWLFERIRRR